MMINSIISLLICFSSVLLEVSGQELFQIGFGGVRWRRDCDMVGIDFHFKRGPAEKCGTFCKDLRDCKAFTWTNKNGGTCWMKNKNWRFQDGLKGAFCGYITGRVSDNDRRLGNVGKRPMTLNNNITSRIRNVEARYWREHTDFFGCQMPENANYQLVHALALGQSTDLGNLTFRSGLCGQVLSVDCGFGAVDAVIASSCNIGNTSCGLELMGRTWRRLTNNQLFDSFNTAQCSVSLSNRNPIEGKGPLCFKRPYTETHDLDNAAVGVLNTGGRISSSATLAGVEGSRGNDSHWFHFSSWGFFKGESPLVFQFEDGSSVKFKLGDCVIGGSVHVFTS